MTDGKGPTAARASRTSPLWSWVPTRTAISPATRSRSPNFGCAASRAAMSAARSLDTSDRTVRMSILLRGPTPTWSRRTTRSRSGAGDGAPLNREPVWVACTGRTTISRVAQLRATHQRLEGRHQRRVAAPVVGQRRLRSGGACGSQIGEHVTAAEGVDRLLGVADQNQRCVPGEGQPQDVPLHRVGVLELVDQDERTSVTASDPGRPLPPVPAHRRAGSAGRRSRAGRGCACGDRLPAGQRARIGAGCPRDYLLPRRSVPVGPAGRAPRPGPAAGRRRG